MSTSRVQEQENQGSPLVLFLIFVETYGVLQNNDSFGFRPLGSSERYVRIPLRSVGLCSTLEVSQLIPINRIYPACIQFTEQEGNGGWR